MKLIFLAIILGLTLSTVLSSNCLTGYTNFQLHYTNNQNTVSNSNTYVSEFNAGTPVCTQQDIPFVGVSAHGNCGTATSYGGQSFAFKFEFGFTLGVPGSVSINIGIDFGLGGVVLIDGVEITHTFLDQWWAGSWSNPGQLLLSINNLPLDGNCHVVQIYGKEACCDGPQTIQINANGDGWVDVTPQNLGNLYEQPVVQSSPPCVGEAFWTSLSPSVPAHWCYCNCWIPGASWDANANPPYILAQLAPACALFPQDVRFYTTCLWSCPADTAFNSFGHLDLQTWLNDCVYH